jgi:hypothetical protein
MFFDREDALAVHTVAATAFQILRDITKQRGGNFTEEFIGAGILNIAKPYSAATLHPEKKAFFEGSGLISRVTSFPLLFWRLGAALMVGDPSRGKAVEFV